MSSLRSAFLRHVAQTSPQPDGFEVSHGKGIYLFDKDGNAFIDCISGITVSSLGHAHPGIIKAIQHQLELHLHTQVYGEHITVPQVRLAEALAAFLPPKLSTTYFVNSGAEAVEGALKLAKKFTGRHEIIAYHHAYHGSTSAGDSLRSDVEHTASSRPLLPGIRHVRFNMIEDLAIITEQTAAVIIEPIQGEAGVILPLEGYLKAVRKKCDATGAVLIFDEIQTGMGRTGHLWAFENEHVVPDILLLAKAFGGGLPLGAFISSQEMMGVLAFSPPLGHMTTFGGNGLCCAAGLEALRIIIDEGLPKKAIALNEIILDGLKDHQAIKEIRGRGLMLAIELHDHTRLHDAINACRREGLLLDWFLFNDRSIRLAPPLIITQGETEILVEKLKKALNSL